MRKVSGVRWVAVHCVTRKMCSFVGLQVSIIAVGWSLTSLFTTNTAISETISIIAFCPMRLYIYYSVILFVRLFSDAISTAPGPIVSIKQIRRLLSRISVIVLLFWGKENSVLWFDYATPLRTLFLDGHRHRGHVRQTIVCERHELCGTRSIVRVSPN